MKKVWNSLKALFWCLFQVLFLAVAYFGIMAGIAKGLEKYLFFPEASVYITTILFVLIFLSQVLVALDKGSTFRDLWEEFVRPKDKDTSMYEVDYLNSSSY